MGRPRLVDDSAVLQAAAHVISREGLPALTLARVAAEAGLAPSTVVQRFGSKRGLLLALARRGLAEVEERFDAARARHASPLAALLSALPAMASPISRPGEIAHHLALLQIDLIDPEFHALARRQQRELRRHIASLLEEAMRAGELQTAAPQELAQTVLTIYNGVLVTWAVDPVGGLAGAIESEVRHLLGRQSAHAAADPAAEEHGRTPSRSASRPRSAGGERNRPETQATG